MNLITKLIIGEFKSKEKVPQNIYLRTNIDSDIFDFMSLKGLYSLSKIIAFSKFNPLMTRLHNSMKLHNLFNQ